MEFTLIRHPLSPPSAIDSICVDVARLDGAKLALRYRITGDIAAISIPGLVTPGRAENLWQTTCFEAFLKLPDSDYYVEFNFSPSTRWAGYVFDGYRKARQDFTHSSMPRIDMAVGRNSFELGVTLDLTGNRDIWRTSDVFIGLSAVIEMRSREKSYWALAHPPGAPDFHHRDCFAGILRAPERP
ncbi:MAG TPA: DOMON-like domain-containing protein [Sphingobium sp.]